MASNYDLLVDLYEVDFKKKEECSYKIIRVLSPNSDKVVDFITTNFNVSWASEAKAALYRPNPTCFIAVDNKKIIGFACYDATAKGFFGPLGVDPNYRGKKIGQALTLTCLEALYNDGYAYAIIGGVSERTKAFYDKICRVTPISNSRKIYTTRLVEYN